MSRFRGNLQPKYIAPVFFAADEADTRCVQACYRMLVGRSRGVLLSAVAADEETDYASGRLTWQFAMLLSLAEAHSRYVLDFEGFDVELFVKDPRAAITDQIGDEEAVEYQFANSDIDLEVERARRCLEHPRITFVPRTPIYDDLMRITSSGAQVSCVINGGPLVGEETYRPHSIVVRQVVEDGVTIDDPGPPPRACWALTREEFEGYWLDPNPGVANLIAANGDPSGWLDLV